MLIYICIYICIFSSSSVYLRSLSSQRVGIDLSIWILEASTLFQRIQRHTSTSLPPHLHTSNHVYILFQRCIHLAKLGIHTVYVTDGIMPTIKNNKTRTKGNYLLTQERRVITYSLTYFKTNICRYASSTTTTTTMMMMMTSITSILCMHLSVHR